MRRRPKTALGIEVCRDRVQLALIASAPAAPGWRLLRAASAPLPTAALGDGGPADVTALTRVLRKLRRRARVGRMKAAVAMSMHPLVVQLLDLPDPMPANVGEFVDHELRQYVALSGRNVTSDFCAAGAAGSASRRLLSVAGERATLRNLAKACDGAGITAAAIEPPLLAYARATQRDKASLTHQGKRLLVEISAHQLSACVLCNGVLEAVRVKDIPSETHGPNGADRWLLEQLQMMIRYYGADRGNGSYEVRVVLRDGVPLKQETLAVVQASSDPGAVTVETPQETDRQSTGRDEKASPPPASKVAVGLALKMLDDDGDAWRVNLLPDEVEQTRSFARHALVAANVAALMVLGMIVTLQFMTHTANKKRYGIERTRASQKLYATRTLAMKADALECRLDQRRNEVQRIQEVLGAWNDVDWPSLLRSIRDVAPAAVCITQLASDDAENLYLNGLALSYEGVRAFAQGLDGRNLFESVSLTKVEKAQGERALIRYQIDCLLKTTR